MMDWSFNSRGHDAKIEELVGKTLVLAAGMSKGSVEVTFITEDGVKYKMEHIQDCCECVRLEDVVGDPADLVGSPILRAEERSEDAGSEEVYESGTWTFYELATNKGSVTLRWLGTSNGYYSERVDLLRHDPE